MLVHVGACLLKSVHPYPKEAPADPIIALLLVPLCPSQNISPEMLAMMKSAKFDQGQVEQQFKSMGMKPEDVMSKVRGVDYVLGQDLDLRWTRSCDSAHSPWHCLADSCICPCTCFLHMDHCVLKETTLCSCT